MTLHFGAWWCDFQHSIFNEITDGEEINLGDECRAWQSMKQSMSNHELALCQWQVHKINIAEGYVKQKLLQPPY